MKIDLIVGARPNYMKAAPIYRALQKYPEEFQCRIVHTGQHYDSQMYHIFFQELELPEPEIYLKVGSGLHGEQTGNVMIRYEEVVLENKADLTLVVGDVNSTMACSLVAVKLHAKVGHVEAGLRSRDWSMPEEVNRVVTDSVADLLFTTSKDADENLKNEGIPAKKIYFVGNTMIDSLNYYLPRVDSLPVLESLNLESRNFVLITIHRPSNVDRTDVFRGLFEALGEIQKRLPVVFPIHPRSRKMMDEFGLNKSLSCLQNLKIIDPLGYLDFLKLQKEAALVLTDSGGIQEETTVLGVPCLTLRDNTERPVTIIEGTNDLVGSDPGKIVDKAVAILDGERKEGKIPELWDGHAAERIVDILKNL